MKCNNDQHRSNPTNSDASDATLEIPAKQLLSQEPLSGDELELTVSENHRDDQV